jgi:hypothetical protein
MSTYIVVQRELIVVPVPGFTEYQRGNQEVWANLLILRGHPLPLRPMLALTRTRTYSVLFESRPREVRPSGVFLAYPTRFFAFSSRESAKKNVLEPRAGFFGNEHAPKIQKTIFGITKSR